MKVLQVVADMGQGGAQSYVLDLIRKLSEYDDVDVELLALFSRGALWQEVAETGTKLYCLEMNGAKDLIRFFQLYKVLNQGKYDVIHVHAIFPLLGLFLYLFSSRSYRIYTEHAGGLLKGELLSSLVYWVFPWCYHKFIAVSVFMRNIMLKASPLFKISSKVAVIYNGSDLDRIECGQVGDRAFLPYPFNGSQFLIGTVARLEAQKGVRNFLDAAEKILDLRDDIYFVIVGDGSQREELVSYAEQKGILQHVLFLGYWKNAVDIMRCFDIFLFVSNQEAFGLVITEAMAVGVPVVALDIESAVPELITDGSDGYIIKGKDFNSLAIKVCELLDHQELREKFITNARKKVETAFSMHSNVRAIRKLYFEHA